MVKNTLNTKGHINYTKTINKKNGDEILIIARYCGNVFASESKLITTDVYHNGKLCNDYVKGPNRWVSREHYITIQRTEKLKAVSSGMILKTINEFNTILDSKSIENDNFEFEFTHIN